MDERQFLAHILANAEDHGGWRAGMTNDDYLLQADAVIASGWVVHLPLDCQDHDTQQAEMTEAQAAAWDQGYRACSADDWMVTFTDNPYRAAPDKS